MISHHDLGAINFIIPDCSQGYAHHGEKAGSLPVMRESYGLAQLCSQARVTPALQGGAGLRLEVASQCKAPELQSLRTVITHFLPQCPQL